MKCIRNITKTLFVLIFVSTSCTYDINPLPPGPPIPEETTDLEASFVTSPPNSVNSPYWITADYIVEDLQNVSTGKVNPDDGVLNTNNMQGGLADFNRGDSSGIILKSAYDDEYVYILAEWTDNSYDGSQLNWIYNGPKDQSKPAEDTAGWTSQKNDDNLFLIFEGGTKKDIWKWSFAVSEPLGYAIDMYDDGSGEKVDEGDFKVKRNSTGSTNRTGPEFEWSGEIQEIERPLAPVTRLDPALYLFNTKEFEGDIVQGEIIYQAECAECHGSTGDGLGEDGGFDSFVPMTDPTLNRLDPSAMDASLSAPSHSGRTYWTGLDETEKTDLIARIRGFAGVPGFVLDDAGGDPPDVQAISAENLALVNIYSRDKKTYKVLLIRPLITGSDDDVQFDLTEKKDYDFGIYLTDDDNENRVGVPDKKLIFK